MENNRDSGASFLINAVKLVKEIEEREKTLDDCLFGLRSSTWPDYLNGLRVRLEFLIKEAFGK